MDNEPSSYGTVIAYVVAAIGAAVGAIKAMKLKLFPTPGTGPLTTEMQIMNKNLIEQRRMLTRIDVNLAVYEERFRNLDRRISRLEDNNTGEYRRL